MVVIADLTSVGFTNGQANHIMSNMFFGHMSLTNAEIAEVKLLGYNSLQATNIVGNIAAGNNLAQAEQLAPGITPTAILKTLGYSPTDIAIIQGYESSTWAKNLFQAECFDTFQDTSIQFTSHITPSAVLKILGINDDKIAAIQQLETLHTMNVNPNGTIISSGELSVDLLNSISQVFAPKLDPTTGTFSTAQVTPAFIYKALGLANADITAFQKNEADPTLGYSLIGNIGTITDPTKCNFTMVNAVISSQLLCKGSGEYSSIISTVGNDKYLSVPGFSGWVKESLYMAGQDYRPNLSL